MSCRACRRPIVFVKMRTGKSVPCDPVPDQLGNVIALRTPGGWIDGYVQKPAVVSNPPLPLGCRRLMPHYATCPAYQTQTTPAPAPQPTLEF